MTSSSKRPVQIFSILLMLAISNVFVPETSRAAEGDSAPSNNPSSDTEGLRARDRLRNRYAQIMASPGTSFGAEADEMRRERLKAAGVPPEQIERRLELARKVKGLSPMGPVTTVVEKGTIFGIPNIWAKYFRSIRSAAMTAGVFHVLNNLNDAEKAANPEGSPLFDVRAVSDSKAPRKVESPAFIDRPVGTYITVLPGALTAPAAASAASGAASAAAK